MKRLWEKAVVLCPLFHKSVLAAVWPYLWSTVLFSSVLAAVWACHGHRWIRKHLSVSYCCCPSFLWWRKKLVGIFLLKAKSVISQLWPKHTFITVRILFLLLWNLHFKMHLSRYVVASVLEARALQYIIRVWKVAGTCIIFSHMSVKFVAFLLHIFSDNTLNVYIHITKNTEIQLFWLWHGVSFQKAYKPSN